MLRVLFALPGLHRVLRGAETAFEEIAGQLARLPEYRVILAGSGLPLPDRPYEYIQVPCRPREKFGRFPSLPAFRNANQYEEFSFAWNLSKIYDPADYDLTVACSWPWTHWLLRARKIAGHRPKHLFVTQNGDYMIRARRREYALFSCDGLVCTNCEYFNDNHWRFPSTLIPNGVDPQIFRPASAERWRFNLPNDAPVALMVSALIGSKRLPDGLRAAARVPDLHLLLAGDGELRRDIERLGHDLLGERFHLLQLPRSEMPALYRCADVFLHMSLDEPSANVYLEALSTGLPIIAHDRAVTRWTLEDQALLIDTTDSQAVTDALSRALKGELSSTPDSRHALAQRRFSWSSLAQQYAEFFQAVSSQTMALTCHRRAEAVGTVVIGRNEGERLKTCLRSLLPHFSPVVYVDSGSTDGSVEFARSLNVSVVCLDPSLPFTAARARNEGLHKLLALAPNLQFVQFLDGDCEFLPDFLPAALSAMRIDQRLAAVCGRRRERHPDASLYNRLTDLEWNAPPGPTHSVGGDALFRVASLQQVGLYDSTLIAGEEPELCFRLRRRGWHVLRLSRDMTLHDAAMARFGQWWKRMLRAGHAYAEAYALHGHAPEHFRRRECRSILFWALAMPLLSLLALALGHPLWVLLLLLFYPFLGARIFIRKCAPFGPADAALYAAFALLAKFPQLLGMALYLLNRLRHRRGRLIEYKTAAVR